MECPAITLPDGHKISPVGGITGRRQIRCNQWSIPRLHIRGGWTASVLSQIGLGAESH